jgi:molybdate transport system substrate-binding protein
MPLHKTVQILIDWHDLQLLLRPVNTRFISSVFATLLLASTSGHADTFQIAVAANFAAPLKSIAALFEQETGHRVQSTTGATGKFYAQIKNGAPFDVFLSADEETAIRLEKEGDAVVNTRFSYATGRLVLWSARAGVVDAAGDVLKTGKFSHLAVASPKLAPYGVAAVETLTRMGLLAAVEPKFVIGESLGQTYSFIETGNAELGFVALAQVIENGNIKSGSGWLVPADLHRPIVQDAVLLRHGKDNAAAQAFLHFLKSEKIKALIRDFGYGVPR